MNLLDTGALSYFKLCIRPGPTEHRQLLGAYWAKLMRLQSLHREIQSRDPVTCCGSKLNAKVTSNAIRHYYNPMILCHIFSWGLGPSLVSKVLPVDAMSEAGSNSNSQRREERKRVINVQIQTKVKWLMGGPSDLSSQQYGIGPLVTQTKRKISNRYKWMKKGS
ncbi:unnamed protein product [Dovyalis caffra]|uniref:Uncharacterized protein n=1 Tax=Dovyalis caffra TaxID=77055 RepID=A0AAV1S8V0_9ROSI|nr:unnamed protein product [Dovyalis caffra]